MIFFKNIYNYLAVHMIQQLILSKSSFYEALIFVFVYLSEPKITVILFLAGLEVLMNFICYNYNLSTFLNVFLNETINKSTIAKRVSHIKDHICCLFYRIVSISFGNHEMVSSELVIWSREPLMIWFNKISKYILFNILSVSYHFSHKKWSYWFLFYP